MVVAQVTHRPTWRLVDRFLPLTTFMAGQLAEIGLSPGTMTVIPNAVADPGAVGPPGRSVLFAGRLDPEKGVDVLLEAWQLSGLGTERELVIAGDGPLLATCRAATAQTPGLTVLGRVAPEEVGRLMESSALLVVPSVCDEGFPRVVVEAFARSRPVLASSVESLACIVDDAVGWLAEPSAAALAAALRTALEGDSLAKGAAARSRYLDRYQPDVVLAQLLQVYDEIR
jgi:glycosyltransferase involved in cell wall biosynthesis